MSLALTSVLYGSLCYPSFYVTWSHFRSVWVSILSDCLCDLVSLPFCMGLYVVRVSMSLGRTSVLYGYLYFPCFYGTWSHFRYVWVSMLSEFLCHFRSVLVSMFSEFLCHLVSLPLCMVLYVVRVSMSLGLISAIYGSPCCPSFHVTWSLFHSTWVSMLSEFLCHLVSLSLCCPIFCIGFVLPLCSSLCYLCS